MSRTFDCKNVLRVRTGRRTRSFRLFSLDRSCRRCCDTTTSIFRAGLHRKRCPHRFDERQHAGRRYFRRSDPSHGGLWRWPGRNSRMTSPRSGIVVTVIDTKKATVVDNIPVGGRAGVGIRTPARTAKNDLCCELRAREESRSFSTKSRRSVVATVSLPEIPSRSRLARREMALCCFALIRYLKALLVSVENESVVADFLWEPPRAM